MYNIHVKLNNNVIHTTDIFEINYKICYYEGIKRKKIYVNI